jgi:hypothetical protein
LTEASALTLLALRFLAKWNDNDYDVLADGAVVGRILKVHAAPVGSPWMWTLVFWFTKTARRHTATSRRAMAASPT